MLHQRLSMLAMLMAITLTPLTALADTDASQLGKSLTPVGAEKAGNADGSIPSWEGGLTTAPAGFKPGAHYPNPFPDEKPLFTITGANAEQYKEKLSPGQLAMLKKYATYKLPVYPSHRTASFPKQVYESTLYDATHAKLAPGGNGVQGADAGFPFPIPKDGQEAIWNHLLSYRGDTYATNFVQVMPTRDGAYTPVRMEMEYDFSYGNLSKSAKDKEPNKLLNFLQVFTEPARLAGSILLVHEPIDQVKQSRSSWSYSPGQRRVRLAPEVNYDNPAASADGLRTNDDFWMYNGAIDRYNWKLLGKKEMYIPYNSYAIMDPKLKIADLVRPGHLNQDYTRYELHRVWVVEATLKPEFRNIYTKRVFFLDEDSWAAVAIDKYDARGELWRVAEQHNLNLYDVPMRYGAVDTMHDLQSGRYIAMGLRNEEPWFWKPLKRTPADYTPANLRNLGVR